MSHNIQHTEEREKEVQELCIKVLNASPHRYYNPDGADETTCPFCLEINYANQCTADMKDIEHKVDCAYNIAKGLSARVS